MKRLQKTTLFKVALTYASKIPLGSIAVAHKGGESPHAQSTLMVLNVMLRQQQARMSVSSDLCCILFSFFILGFFEYYLIGQAFMSTSKTRIAVVNLYHGNWYKYICSWLVLSFRSVMGFPCCIAKFTSC